MNGVCSTCRRVFKIGDNLTVDRFGGFEHLACSIKAGREPMGVGVMVRCTRCGNLLQNPDAYTTAIGRCICRVCERCFKEVRSWT